MVVVVIGVIMLVEIVVSHQLVALEEEIFNAVETRYMYHPS